MNAGAGEKVMPIMDHLRELRTRIIRSLLAVSVGTVVLLVFYDDVIHALATPYRDLCASHPKYRCNGTFFLLGPLDGFAARMRVCAYGGLVLALPVVLWQIWRFIVPALNRRERAYALPFIVSSVTFFAVGCGLAYWTLDKALEFLVNWSGADVSQAFQINKYISLVALMMLAFGVGFLSPVLLVFLQLVGAVRPRTLMRQWRAAIMVIFVVAAVITPSGDPISLLALALPLSLLYFLAVLVGWLATRRRPVAA